MSETAVFCEAVAGLETILKQFFPVGEELFKKRRSVMAHRYQPEQL
jgi:hypothetical protein